MCEGIQDNATPNRRNTRHRRSRQIHNQDSSDEGDEPDDFNAIDESPAVYRLSDGWQQCDLIPRTPQHLVTLVARNPTTSTWSASPILWKERYLITPTMSGQILFWDLTKVLRSSSNQVGNQKAEDGDAAGKSQNLHDFSHETEVSEFLIHSNHTPDFVLDTIKAETDEREANSAFANGTAILQICIGSPAVLGDGKEVLVAISVTGCVYIFDLDFSDLNLITLASSFSTGKLDLRCVSTTRKGLIVVGYHSGRLEAWKLEARSPPKKVAPSPQESERKEITYRKKLMWRGWLMNAPEIRSVLQLRYPEAVPSDVPDEFLILTIQQEGMISTAAMVKVINISLVQKAWQEMLQSDENATEVGLDDFSLLALPGMEIINPTTGPSESQGTVDFRHRPWAPNSGTDSLVRIERSLPDGSMLACAVILAEGSVLLITTSVVDGEPEWGIRGTCNQLLLSFPAIGVGCSLQTVNEDTVPNIGCCLRGGTSYLIPCDSGENTERVDSITVITYPHDIDTDNPPHRVDFFSSGCIHYPAEDRKFTKTTIPILIYCWPGGIIDVYAGELLQERKVYTHAILTELLSNGTVQLFREHLLSLKEETLASHQADWRFARDEILKIPSSDSIVLSNLLSSSLRAFRSILISQEL